MKKKNITLLRSKLGIRRDTNTDLLGESIDEDPERKAWLELPEGRIAELIREANPQTKNGGFKRTFIALLDSEIRKRPSARQQAATPPVAAAPPTTDESIEAMMEEYSRENEAIRATLTEKELYYFDLYGRSQWRAVKERDDAIDARKAREQREKEERERLQDSE